MYLNKIRLRAYILLFAGLLSLTGLSKWANAQSHEPISGVPRVLEGDILQVGGVVVRLYGIDAPEKTQTCDRETGSYSCGLVAKTGLMDLVAGAETVVCYVEDVMTDGTPIALCRDPQGFDLSQQMVYTGWAFALPDGPLLFHEIQEKSQKAKRGLWKGTAVPPWRWQNP